MIGKKKQKKPQTFLTSINLLLLCITFSYYMRVGTAGKDASFLLKLLSLATGKKGKNL